MTRASGGNEPKVRTVRGFIDAKKSAGKKEKPYPKAPPTGYTMTADGMVLVSPVAYANAMMSRETHAKREEDIRAYWVEKGVCQEPYLPGENYERYCARTGSSG